MAYEGIVQHKTAKSYKTWRFPLVWQPPKTMVTPNWVSSVDLVLQVVTMCRRICMSANSFSQADCKYMRTISTLCYGPLILEVKLSALSEELLIVVHLICMCMCIYYIYNDNWCHNKSSIHEANVCIFSTSFQYIWFVSIFTMFQYLISSCFITTSLLIAKILNGNMISTHFTSKSKYDLFFHNLKIIGSNISHFSKGSI